MAGARWAQKVQLGQEATAGTPVAATDLWRGIGGMLEDVRDTVRVPELLGTAAPGVRTYNPRIMARLAMAATPFTPEQGLHIFEAGIKGAVTATEDGTGGSGYVRDYPLGLTTANTLKFYTIESGDNNQAEEAEYCFVESFTISAQAGGVVEVSANWIGRQVSNTTFTGAITAPAVNDLLASNAEFYIDEPSGTIGTTQITAGNLLGWTLNVNTGWRGKWTTDSGQLYFLFAYFDLESFSAQLQLKWEHDTSAVTEKGKFRSNTNRLIRIDTLGDDYATPGTTPTLGTGQKGLRVDFPGSYTEFSALDAEDGNSIINATLEGGYDTESGEVLTLTVCNELSAVP